MAAGAKSPAAVWEHAGSWELVGEYVWGPETQQMFAAIDDVGEVLFPVLDGRQSTVAVFNETQTRVTEYRQYDAEARMRVLDYRDRSSYRGEPLRGRHRPASGRLHRCDALDENRTAPLR